MKNQLTPQELALVQDATQRMLDVVTDEMGAMCDLIEERAKREAPTPQLAEQLEEQMGSVAMAAQLGALRRFLDVFEASMPPNLRAVAAFAAEKTSVHLSEVDPEGIKEILGLSNPSKLS